MKICKITITHTLDEETGAMHVEFLSEPEDLSKIEALGMLALATDIVINGGDED